MMKLAATRFPFSPSRHYSIYPSIPLSDSAGGWSPEMRHFADDRGDEVIPSWR